LRAALSGAKEEEYPEFLFLAGARIYQRTRRGKKKKSCIDFEHIISHPRIHGEQRRKEIETWLSIGFPHESWQQISNSDESHRGSEDSIKKTQVEGRKSEQPSKSTPIVDTAEVSTQNLCTVPRQAA
jgi:hypothetical protein